MDESKNKIILSRYSFAEKQINIPKGVCSIPHRHFEEYDKLTSIKLPDSIRSVGDYAFKGCSSLTVIFLLEGLLSIGVGCFSNCTSMSVVHIPNSVSNIKKEAFKRCESLVAVCLPNQLATIEDFCFYQCKKLQRVIVPSSIKCISQMAFFECLSLTEIRFHSNRVKIGKGSFKGCALKKVEFERLYTNPQDFIGNIGASAFENCFFLVEVNLSSYPVYTLKGGCFRNCKSLRSVFLSRNTRKIMGGCFATCISLKFIGYEPRQKPKFIRIPRADGTHEISRYEHPMVTTENRDTKCGLDLEHIDYFDYVAFAECKSLESIKLYDHNIRCNTFDDCKNIKKISLQGDMYFRNNESCLRLEGNKVEELEVRYYNNSISYHVAYHVMYEIIIHNPGLFEKCCTKDNLYPFEVALGVLYVMSSSIQERDDDWIIKVLYHYLRESPWILEKYLRKISK